MKPKIVRCPQCGSQAEYRIDNPSRPFCSERCKLIDLGAWAEERYAIAGAPVLTDSLEVFEANDGENSTGTYVAVDWTNRRLNS